MVVIVLSHYFCGDLVNSTKSSMIPPVLVLRPLWSLSTLIRADLSHQDNVEMMVCYF